MKKLKMLLVAAAMVSSFAASAKVTEVLGDIEMCSMFHDSKTVKGNTLEVHFGSVLDGDTLVMISQLSYTKPYESAVEAVKVRFKGKKHDTTMSILTNRRVKEVVLDNGMTVWTVFHEFGHGTKNESFNKFMYLFMTYQVMLVDGNVYDISTYLSDHALALNKCK